MCSVLCALSYVLMPRPAAACETCVQFLSSAIRHGLTARSTKSASHKKVIRLRHNLRGKFYDSIQFWAAFESSCKEVITDQGQGTKSVTSRRAAIELKLLPQKSLWRVKISHWYDFKSIFLHQLHDFAINNMYQLPLRPFWETYFGLTFWA